MQRIIELEGAYNLRDLGGLETADGYEVRFGKLFRSDSLHKLTNADMTVMQGYGINTVLDLRLNQEIATTGVARLVEHGARHVQISLMTNEPVAPLASHPTRTLGELYTWMVRESPDRFVEAITLLGDIDHMPAVFHCAVGKDRTGITAALIYSILGVDREEIIRDYVITEQAMLRVMDTLSQSEVEREGKTLVHHSYVHAEDETIRTFLGWLDEEFGSPVEWLVTSGLQPRVIDDLRREMLV
ncbi:MAG: tyrosine-protein phosphatase [Thermomicrobiales bacterium]|nr:tyrosine-protein phosphatase [Thermomicrobiales bacterium]